MAMFTPAPTPEQEEATRQQRALEMARLTPDQRSFMYGRAAGEGLANAAGGAMGVDVRGPGAQQRDAETAAKAEIAALEIDPTDLKAYYPAVIRILMKHKLVDAAQAVQKEFRDNLAKTEDQKIKREEITRKTTADTQRYQTALAKIEVDQAKAERMGRPAIQLISQIEQMQRAANDLLDTDPRKEMIAANIERLKQALEVELAKNKFKMQAAGGRMVIIDQTTGDTREGPEITAKPPTEKEAKASDAVKDKAMGGIRQAKQDIANAAELFAHPGLSGITGAVYGRTPSVSEASMSAMALYEQVQAGTFLAALRSLKGQENKPTGLGQLTEVEGAKIQNAMAALSRVQSTESFKARLEKYIRQIESTIDVLAAAVDQPVDNTPVQLQKVGKTSAKVAERNAAKPAPVPAPEKKATGGKVRMIHPKTGKLGMVPAEQVEAALQQGYKRAP